MPENLHFISMGEPLQGFWNLFPGRSVNFRAGGRTQSIHSAHMVGMMVRD